ncbi:hypothetical protein VP01_4725g1 [Puccinia sorghi]|uniref:Uncharacterized protein n=1 Tax=Puccinia sorghi TaxID=27349 RepID=A0A0L6UMY8_9BASI|nr:hypothetical protein VP01_4725g1 [Puccinia sorghi]
MLHLKWISGCDLIFNEVSHARVKESDFNGSLKNQEIANRGIFGHSLKSLLFESTRKSGVSLLITNNWPPLKMAKRIKTYVVYLVGKNRRKTKDREKWIETGDHYVLIQKSTPENRSKENTEITRGEEELLIRSLRSFCDLSGSDWVLLKINYLFNLEYNRITTQLLHTSCIADGLFIYTWSLLESFTVSKAENCIWFQSLNVKLSLVEFCVLNLIISESINHSVVEKKKQNCPISCRSMCLFSQGETLSDCFPFQRSFGKVEEFKSRVVPEGDAGETRAGRALGGPEGQSNWGNAEGNGKLAGNRRCRNAGSCGGEGKSCGSFCIYLILSSTTTKSGEKLGVKLLNTHRRRTLSYLLRHKGGFIIRVSHPNKLTIILEFLTLLF